MRIYCSGSFSLLGRFLHLSLECLSFVAGFFKGPIFFQIGVDFLEFGIKGFYRRSVGRGESEVSNLER